MTLTITSDIIIDEEFRATQTGTLDDDDTTLAAYNGSAFKSAFDALSLAVPTTPPTGFPQYAEQQGFVTSSNPVTNYFLVADGSGGAFSAGGTGTDLYVGSNRVFLFATANSDIIIGRIGSGTTADPTGAIALVIGIEENKTGSTVDSADLWLTLYAPITQNGLNLIDSADQLNLDDLVYLGANYETTTQIPFENFSGVPSGNNLFNVIFPSDGSSAVQLLVTGSTGETLSTVNVSTTGIGAGSQHIDVGATLRIDTVQGMVKSTVDSAPEVNNANNIVYTDTADPGTDPRVEIVKADFEVTQLNPGSTPERVTILVSAFNAVGAAQQGAYLTDAIASDGVPVTIDAADVVVLNGAGQDITSTLQITQQGDSVLIAGLDDGTSADKTDGYQVFFSTDGVRFDRFLITNMDPDGTTLDVGNIHVTAVEGGTGTEYKELGDRIIYQDDGPQIVGTGSAAPTVQADDSTLSVNPTGDFSGVFGTKDYGADGAGTDAYTLAVKSANVASGLVDTGTGQNVLLSYDSVNNKVIGKTSGTGQTVFEISVNASGVVTLDQQRAIKHTDTNDFNSSVSMTTADLVTLTLKITDGEAANHNDSATQTVNIAADFIFYDDGPKIAVSADANAPNDLVVKNLTTSAGQDSSSYGLTPGADGLKSFEILNPDGTGDFTWQYFDVDGVNGTEHNEIKGAYKGVDLYTLELQDNGSYVFKMIGTLPSSTLNLSTAEIKAGAPDTNAILVGAIENDDYVQIAGGGGAINESNGFVGVKNGNLDTGESLTFKLYDQKDGTSAPDPTADTQLSFQGLVIGSKSAQSSTYHVEAKAAAGGTDFSHDILVGKNQPLIFDPAGDQLYTEVTITKVSGPALKIGVGDIDILIPPNDVQLSFTVRETDGDSDYVDASFTVSIDGNNDGFLVI